MSEVRRSDSGSKIIDALAAYVAKYQLPPLLPSTSRTSSQEAAFAVFGPEGVIDYKLKQ